VRLVDVGLGKLICRFIKAGRVGHAITGGLYETVVVASLILVLGVTGEGLNLKKK